jgi:hypothetical protein
MGRPKVIKDDVRLSIVLSKAQAYRVKFIAIQMSKREGRMISVSEALRMAIETVYPVPKNQGELF